MISIPAWMPCPALLTMRSSLNAVWKGDGDRMPATLTIRDETATGELLGETVLEFLTERITVRELIRSRVYQEVKDYNTKRPEYFRGLVQPSDAEKTLDGYKIRKARQVNWKAQFEAAVEAFEQNRIVVLVDDRQAEGLDEEIVIAPRTKLSFLKLVPLVGG